MKASSSEFGAAIKELFGAEIPVTGSIGDQQSSLFGQACFDEGDVKITYGTGAFLLCNTGRNIARDDKGLLSTVAWDLGEGPVYALEGSVFTAGAVAQWLRDQLRIIDNSAESETLARSVPDNGGVYFVPAFSGLGGPHWDPDARGAVFGLTRGSNRAHIARAALESVAFQSWDLIELMQKRLGRPLSALKADGGASANSFLMQFQADIAGVPLAKSAVTETTALGAACAAGLGCGFWGGPEEIKKRWQSDRQFAPSMKTETREKLLKNWRSAVAAAMSFKT